MKGKHIPSEDIVKNCTYTLGKGTVVALTHASGIKAYGLSLKSASDAYNKERGYSIARGRAERAMALKLKGKRIQHTLMW